MRDLLRDPAWRPEDLGLPIPDSPHACLVSLPTWDAVIGYEEGREDVVGRFKAGYPRFFLHPWVQKLNRELERRVAGEGERVVAFPTEPAAKRALDYVGKQGGSGKVETVAGLRVLVVPEDSYAAGRAYWRHAGEVVSSRRAEDVLAGRSGEPPVPSEFREAMGDTMHCAPQDLFVFESGMAAISAVYRLLTRRRPGKKTLQLCFPYVDALKVQEQFGSGVDFVPVVSAAGLELSLAAIREDRYAAVFCEVPSNPLLNTVDLPLVAQACRVSGTPLVVDDTVCSHLNLDAGGHADVVTTSLTKWVSGIGDVMAGSAKLTGGSPLRDELRDALEVEVPGGSLLYGRDAGILVENARGFSERVATSNAVAEPVVEFLAAHPAVERVWHPSVVDRDLYDALRVPTGGYGGLLSFTLRSPERAPAVYNATRLSKGPSLGTEYSLLCPYTLLAHYEELPWAEQCGVATNLLRLSVGMESPESLTSILGEALEHA